MFKTGSTDEDPLSFAVTSPFFVFLSEPSSIRKNLNLKYKVELLYYKMLIIYDFSNRVRVCMPDRQMAYWAPVDLAEFNRFTTF